MSLFRFYIYLFTTVFAILIIASTVISAEDDVKFIVFGDSQFGNPAEFERMVYEASLLKPDFVIQVGDLIHGYTYDKEILRAEWKRYKGQISLLNSPFYPVPGNHDVVTDEAEEVYTEVWGSDKFYYSFDKGPAHIIILNSWWGDEDDRIMEWQRRWLKEDLENYKSQFSEDEFKAKSIFIFLHSPLWKYPEKHEGRQDWNKVHKILNEYPVKLVVGGHTHEHVWQNSDGIDYLVINSAGVSRENVRGGKFSAFLHVSVSEDGSVTSAAIKAGSVFPLDTVDPADRKEAAKYSIEEQTILISDWIEGEPMNRVVEVGINNRLDEERLYRLDWYIPYKSEIEIKPESKWLLVPPDSAIIELFSFNSEHTPPIDMMPHLNISSSVHYRSGVLSRELENNYRNNIVGIDGYTPAIKLDDTFEYSGVYRLYLPPSITAKKLKGNIFIDGKTDEEAWSSANKVIFGNDESMDAVKTEVKILYDNDYLFVSAFMEEPVPGMIQTNAGGDIPLTWNDDDIEFYFDTNRNQKDYIRLFQNAAGTRFNSLQRWVDDKYFQSDYKSAIIIGKDYWSIEMEIPWSDIDLKEAPEPGNKWGFNMGRHRPNGMIKEMRWAGGLYNPQMYGILVFE